MSQVACRRSSLRKTVGPNAIVKNIILPNALATQIKAITCRVNQAIPEPNAHEVTRPPKVLNRFLRLTKRVLIRSELVVEAGGFSMNDPWGRGDIVWKFAGTLTAVWIVAATIICTAQFTGTNAAAQRSRMIFEHPFIVAARNGELLSVRDYLARGDSPEVRDRNGQTPLMIAVQAGDVEMAEDIVAATELFDTKDNQGNTALGLAAIHDQIEIAEFLLAAGASPNVPNRLGMTPLMIAAKEARLLILEILVEHQPDFSLRDYTGRGPLGWARQSRDQSVIRLLELMGATD